jgi:hypothetical protein
MPGPKVRAKPAAKLRGAPKVRATPPQPTLAPPPLLQAKAKAKTKAKAAKVQIVDHLGHSDTMDTTQNNIDKFFASASGSGDMPALRESDSEDVSVSEVRRRSVIKAAHTPPDSNADPDDSSSEESSDSSDSSNEANMLPDDSQDELQPIPGPRTMKQAARWHFASCLQ